MAHTTTGGTVVRKLRFNDRSIRVRVDDGDVEAGAPALAPSYGEYPVYDGALYATMTSDAARNERFSAALAACCPGLRVLDVGTGADLNWALESLRHGARHVDAVEVIEDSYLAARQKLAGSAHRESIVLHSGLSTELSLAVRADVCVGEVIGSVAGAEGAAAVMSDVRERLLAPNGVIVPHRAATLAAGATLRSVLGDRMPAFAVDSLSYLAAIFTATGGPRDVRLRVQDPAVDALVTDSAEVEALDFNGTLRTRQRREVLLRVEREGALDGVLTWMRLWCTPDESPLDALTARTNWASVYFPLFDEEIPVSPGDHLVLSFSTQLSGDGVHPDYHLSATLTAAGRRYVGEHVSRHSGPGFRSSGVHRLLFPEG